MLRSIEGFEGKKSNAHLLLLSKFVHPRKTEYFENDSWKDVLGEPPKHAIERFIKGGLIEEPNLIGTLSGGFFGNELKDMLKKRGLPVSGQKDEMIQRLVDADPNHMKKIAAGLTVLVCTQHGKELADEYITAEKGRRVQVEQQTIECIKERDFKKASSTVFTYEAEQVFPRGGIDWGSHNPDREIGLLNTIFNNTPKILAKLDNDKLENLRIGAAMIALWGKNEVKKWLPPNFETGISLGESVAADMFFFYALHLANLKRFRESGFAYTEIKYYYANSCDACKKLANRKYKLDEVPELPHEHCTNEMGCRCIVSPIID